MKHKYSGSSFAAPKKTHQALPTCAVVKQTRTDRTKTVYRNQDYRICGSDVTIEEKCSDVLLSEKKAAWVSRINAETQ